MENENAAEIERLKSRCKYLESIIKINDIPQLGELVEQFIAISHSQLKKISLAVMSAEYDANKNQQLTKMIDYLEQVIAELEKFYDGSEIIHHQNIDNFKECFFMKTISFINLKGGVGKTTISTNFAYALATSFDVKVLFIDNDKQGNASEWFGANADKGTITNVMMQDAAIGEIIQPTRYSNIDIIPADMGLIAAHAEIIKNTKIDQANILKNALKPVLHKYQICIIDNPPDINVSVFNSMNVTDDVVIVTYPDDDSLSGVYLMLEQLEYARKFNKNINLKGILFNSYLHNELSKAIVKELEDKKLPVFKTKIAYATKNAKLHLALAKRNKKTIFEENKQCMVSRNIWQFTKEIIGCGEK